MGLSDILTGNQNPAIGSRPQKGFMGFLDRVVNPTNVLGMLGKSLAQAGGGLWGDTMSLMDRQKSQGQDTLLKQLEMQSEMRKLQAPHTTQVGKQFGVVDDATGTFRPTYTAPDDTKDTQTSLQRNYEWLKKTNPQAAERYLSNNTTGPLVAMDRITPSGTVREFYTRDSLPGALGAGGAGAPSAAAPGTSGGFDGFYNGYLKGAEGGYTPDDGNGYPANGGVNAKFHPELGDVSKLTPDQIRGVHSQYWQQSGADKIPDPRLAAVHADTAINMGPSVAQGLLAQAGNDPVAYMRLRDQYRQKQLGSLPQWWRQRQHSLAKYIAGLGGGAAAPAGGVVDNSGDDE